ncbi:hypothetical protein [Limnovirga soli]|uniref:hypothetical protein n=1 Tax=Limnovirga soli TaxID=2656915 RepID=UPI001C0F31D0|nr:hypothetical protein [Limnovirga soli]
MNTKYFFWMICSFLLFTGQLHAQYIKLDKNNFEPVNAFLTITKMENKTVIRAIKDAGITAVDEPTFIKLKDIDFTNGIIEVKVLSRLLKDAPDFARGFIGLAFRINDNNTKYESIYLRPVNARVDDQVRRNHSIQYYSYPDYKFDRLRKEAPERYESYADMEMNKWITMRIEVNGTHAKLFLNNNNQPALIVNDLKLGADKTGSVGLWVEVGTEGFFTDLKVTKQ